MTRFCQALALLGLTAGPALAASITNPSFETNETIELQLPSTLADWQGDGGAIVTAENGITPVDGNQMYRYDTTRFGSPSGSTGSQLIQLIDLTPIASSVASGNLVATLSASFNRVAGDTTTDTRFIISIAAYDGLPDAYDDNSPNGIPNLGTNFADIFTDNDPATWQQIATSLTIPPTATYLGIGVSALEDVVNDVTSPEFDGHYTDNVGLSIVDPTAAAVPTPTAALAGLLGLIVVMQRRAS